MTEALRTQQAVEVGCGYGKFLSTRIREIRAENESRVSRSQLDHTWSEEIASDIERRRTDAEMRLLEVETLEGQLAECQNCGGDPENATLSGDSVCPVARFAVYKMTLPGNAGITPEVQ